MTVDAARPAPAPTATSGEEYHLESFPRSTSSDIVDRDSERHHRATPASVMSTSSAETNGEGKASPKSRRNVRYTKDSSQKIRLFGGIRERPQHW